MQGIPSLVILDEVSEPRAQTNNITPQTNNQEPKPTTQHPKPTTKSPNQQHNTPNQRPRAFDSSLNPFTLNQKREADYPEIGSRKLISWILNPKILKIEPYPIYISNPEPQALSFVLHTRDSHSQIYKASTPNPKPYTLNLKP